MGFECPHLLEAYCELQKGKCVPAIGKCVLKGKVKRAKDCTQNEDITKE